MAAMRRREGRVRLNCARTVQLKLLLLCLNMCGTWKKLSQTPIGHRAVHTLGRVANAAAEHLGL